MKRLIFIISVILFSCQQENKEASLLGYWTTKDESMSLIIDKDSIADTEYFGTFRYKMNGDSIQIFYDDPVKLKYSLLNNDTLILEGSEYRNLYTRVR